MSTIPAAPLKVVTSSGVVRGIDRRRVRVWRGIPYAAAPVGDLRLRAPRPPAAWSGVRDCSRFGPVAPQQRLGAFAGAGPFTAMSEDCLSLNVVAPAEPGPDPCPVMVFVHGGAYVFGSSAVPLYGGYSLVRRGGVVYVSLNYRLGALGFMDFSGFSSPERPIESNLGLRDQVAALEWVRDNIAAFGGDPGNVTIFGESAGASSVTTLMTVPAARGLFHRAVAQSAAPAAVYGPERSAGWAKDFVTLIGGPDRLTTAPVGEIVEVTKQFARTVFAALPGGTPFAPAVDGSFLPRHPLDVHAAGAAAPVPLIIGTNDRESSLFFLLGDLLPTTPSTIERMFAGTDPDAMDRVLAAYPGDSIREIGGDAFFWYPSMLVAEGHAGRAPTYAYRYDFSTRLLRALGAGATHGTEMYAVFNAGNLLLGRTMSALGDRAEMRAVHRRVQDNWLHFARYGRPASHWPCYEPRNRMTLVIDSTDRVEGDPRARRRKAWGTYRSYR